MNRRETIRDSLVRGAADVVASVQQEGCSLVGACIVSSLAAGDFTPVSDVDMLLVAADDEGRPGVHRRIVGDQLFEWMVLRNNYLKDVDAILADAGLCHDILTAIILLDKDHWLERVQQQVASLYGAPEWIARRTMGQLHRVATAVQRVQSELARGSILPAQRTHVSVLKGLLAIPRAALNKRCTMARGLPFCREAAAELGWSDYVAEVLTVFGTGDIAEKTVVDLQDIAARIVAATEFSQTEKAIRKWFLQSSPWLLENAEPADAVWPLYFWSSTNVEESGGPGNPLVWEHWHRFAETLGLADEQDLLQKATQARRLHDSVADLVRQEE